MSDLAIIAGPCSVDSDNIKEILALDSFKIDNKKVIAGTRVVGLKSRSSVSDNSCMGIDFEVYMTNLNKYLAGMSHNTFDIPPSVNYIKQIIEKTELVIATEIMNPLIQLPPLAGIKDRLLLWNPSVNQLGWQTLETALFAKENNWKIGIKNGKWTGPLSRDRNNYNSIEKTWAGLVSYAKHATDEVYLIHRGFSTHRQSDFRSTPIHNIASSTKENTGTKLFYDPSHSLGPKLRHRIVKDTIAAMKLTHNGTYLYDGILIEVGNSKTDTDQHITHEELHALVRELSKFRRLLSPQDFMKG